MSAPRNLTGQRFGRLTAISRQPSKDGRSYWICRCDCGKEKVFSLTNIAYGNTQSCGCLQVETRVSANITHGITGTTEHRIWKHLIYRCYSTSDAAYSDYGGRGIRVCEFIRSSPRNLVDLIGLKPFDKSIDRIKNDGHYSCGQCAECLRCGYSLNIRWATRKEQNRNKRNNRLVTFNGETRCVGEWAEVLGVSYSTIWERIVKGGNPYPKSHPFNQCNSPL